MLLRLAVLLAVAACAALAAPGLARADVTLSNVVARPVPSGNTCAPGMAATPESDRLAGSHRDLCVAFNVNQTGNDDLKGLTIHLAPGLLGDPTAATTCPQATFQTGGCGPASQVGTVATTAASPLGDQNLTGNVYNLEPNPDEPARLGIYVLALGGLAEPIALQSTIRTRLTDYGLDSRTVTDIPRQAKLLGGVLPADITVTKMALTLWGAKGDHSTLAEPFITLPTSCQPAATTVDVTAYSGAGDVKGDSFAPAQCDTLPFTPSLTVGPKVVPADHPGEATATLEVPAAVGDNRVQANVKSVELLLPKGLVLSPGLANGLEACTPEQFGLKEDRAPECPASSVIGSVEFVTPLIGTLTGTVYFGTPTPTAKLRNFVAVEDDRLRVKLIGDVTVDPVTGQVRNLFPESPQVPFTKFIFRYKDGPRAVLSSPSACGTDYTAVATMTPWADGVPAAAPRDTFETNDCETAKQFTPSLAIASSNTTASADTGVTVTITRPDRQARLLRSTVSLPAGLAGHLGAVPACPVDVARQAQCSEDSRVGSAKVTVGNGDEPLTLDSRVYLTEAFGGGIAGLAIVVPAKVGPIDLGTVVTLAKLKIRPGDVGIDVETEDLPQIVEGIPTPYRTIELTIDRPGFMLNPTSCGAQAAHGAFVGAGGEHATADAPYQATGCDQLPYAPKFTATLGAPGATKRGAHTAFDTLISQQPGEANTARAVVTLPKELAADPKVLANACPEATLLAGTCPAASKVGKVTANSGLLPFPLTGDIILIKPKAGVLPELSLELPLGIRLRATVGFGPGGALVTTFPTVPDVPLNRLRVTLNGGPGGVLVAGRDLCQGPAPVVATTFVSHGGAQRNSTSTATVPCPPALAASGKLAGVKKRAPTLALKVTANGAKLREVRVAVPKPLRPAKTKALRRGARVTADGRRVKAAWVSVRKGGIVVVLPKAGAGTVRIRLQRGALRQRGTVKIGRRLPFAVEGRPVTGPMLRVTARARARR